MNILYVAPEITLPGSDGGSAHVAGKLLSLQRLGHFIILLCKHSPGQTFFERKHSIFTLRIPLPDIFLLKNLELILLPLFILPFFLIRYRIDLVYERGRIFGGIGVFLAFLFHIRSIYELNEPYSDIPLLL